LIDTGYPWVHHEGATIVINQLMAALYAELAAEEIPQPLAQRFTLATVWADLARLAGEPVPRDVAAVLDTPIGFVPVAGPLSPMGEYTPVYAD